jgi:hypothetical protein
VSNGTGHVVKLLFKASPVFRNSFNKIYLSARWGDDDGHGKGSGHGSSLDYTTNTRVRART